VKGVNLNLEEFVRNENPNNRGRERMKEDNFDKGYKVGLKRGILEGVGAILDIEWVLQDCLTKETKKYIKDKRTLLERTR
jgi:hypothetical protein